MKIDIAYGGSCTGGKKADMDMYARSRAARGKRVAPGVQLYIQFGSQDIRRYAEEQGYLEVFREAGAELVDPSCGACIKAGPGVSDSPDQVTVSAHQPQLPRSQRPGKGLPREPARRRRERHRRPHRLARRGLTLQLHSSRYSQSSSPRARHLGSVTRGPLPPHIRIACSR